MKKIKEIIWNILSDVFYLYCSICHKLKGTLFTPLETMRFGPMLAIPEYILRLYDDKKKTKKLCYIGRSFSTNQYLEKMIQRHLKLINNTFLFQLLLLSKKRFPLSPAWNPETSVGRFNPEPWNSKKYYLLHFNNQEKKKGNALLDQLQLQPNKYVCFANRDAAYLKSLEAVHQIDFSYHNYRDGSIEGYKKAIEYLLGKELKVVRMGAKVESKVDWNFDNFVDYVNLYRSDFGDLYLGANCKFFLGDTSGIFYISNAANIPAAQGNFIPFGAPSYQSHNLYIPKKLFCLKKSRLLTFKELINMGAHTWATSDLYEKNNLKVLENTQDEILNLAIEMNARIDGEWEDNAEDLLMIKTFRSYFPKDYYIHKIKTNIATTFFRSNKNLFE